ncbi:hypothetical protein [Marinobacter shengliensis]|uniref:hypothetical protein n=1 Tax=Marinobacter shengliensis TaxID=1389223 RepID=UPI000D0EB26A|nr:hypothetical protein [Marinobacter shengliensis]PSF15375.1 hypothetical protein C7H10_00415 [Marinobacter shengliensis]
MVWNRQKLFLIGTGVILALLLAFLFGVAFGTAWETQEFKTLILPILSTIGSWLAGIGALGAVIVALWLAEEQRQREKESLNLDFSLAIVPGIDNPVLCVTAVAVGNRPSNIHSISFVSPGAGTQMLVVHFLRGSATIPKVLGYGEKATFLFTEGFEKDIASYLKTYAQGKADKLELVVSTTTENFRLIPDKAMKENFEKLAKDAADAPSRQHPSG